MEDTLKDFIKQNPYIMVDLYSASSLCHDTPLGESLRHYADELRRYIDELGEAEEDEDVFNTLDYFTTDTTF